MANLFVFNYQSNYLAILFLRIILGFVFIAHGWPKLWGKESKHTPAGITDFAKFLKGLGMPVSLFGAWLISILEFFGGLMLVLGFFTQVVACFLALEMLAAAYLKKFKLKVGFSGESGYELDLILFFALLVLFVLGPGIYSVDYYLF